MTPGARVRALIEELGLDQIRFAAKTEVSRQTISNIVNGHQTISREMANRLALLTGRPPGYWLQDEFPEGPSRASLVEMEPTFPPGILVNDQIRTAIESGVIDIDPFDPALLQAASVDLRLDDFVSLSNGKPIDISGGPTKVLRPSEAVNVKTREFVRLPDNFVARVGAMTEVARRGIVVAHGFQIDPGYAGHLQFCLFNASGQNYDLMSGMPIISIEFTSLARRPAGAPPPREHGREDLIEQNVGSLPSAKCDELLRKALRQYVKKTPLPDGVIAEVPELGIRERNKNATAAIDDAVQQVLTTLRSSATQPKYRELHAKYQAFFATAAAQLFLDAATMKVVADALKLAITDNMLDLGNGEFLGLPQGSAEIDLAWLASKMGTPPASLFVRLTRPTRAAFSVAQAAV